jgi:hypothetical protein
VGSYLLQQVPAFLGRERLDQLPLRRGQNAPKANHQDIIEQMGMNVRGAATPCIPAQSGSLPHKQPLPIRPVFSWPDLPPTRQVRGAFKEKPHRSAKQQPARSVPPRKYGWRLLPRRDFASGTASERPYRLLSCQMWEKGITPIAFPTLRLRILAMEESWRNALRSCP